MWMGGTPPLGYKANGRSLAIVEAEAELLRHIFAQYLKLGSVRTLAEALKREGIVSPLRTFASGRTRGGTVMTRGQLYHLLGNPIYIGRIRHRDKTYAGLHEGLVDQDTWDAVQQLLADNTQGTARRRAAGPSLLVGLIYDEAGEPLIASHASKAAPGQTSGKTRYRYYCSKPVHNASSPNTPSTRIPAKDIEHLVRIKLGEALADPLSLAIELQAPLEQALPGAASGPLAQLAGKVQGRDHETLRRLIAKVQVLPAEVRIDLDAAALAQELGWTIPAELTTLRLTSEVKLARTGMARRMVFEDGRAAEAATAKPTLIRLLVRARGWWKQLAAGELTREELARQEGVIPSYVSRVVKLAFLSPRVVEMILAGTHPAALDAGTLLAPGLPASWHEQERMFLRSR
jgi:hypothetical protein